VLSLRSVVGVVAHDISAALPKLEVTGVGSVRLPLQADQAKQIRDVCERAPFGHGTKTKRNTAVRNSWQLEPEKFERSTGTHAELTWSGQVAKLAAQAARDLGVPEVCAPPFPAMRNSDRNFKCGPWSDVRGNRTSNLQTLTQKSLQRADIRSDGS
jgi:hypothetical protein